MKTQLHTFRVRMLTMIMLMTAGLFSANSFAQKTWVGNNNGTWSTGSNWSPSGVPASTDAVIFNTARAVSVDISSFTIKSLTITGSVAVTLTPSTTGSRTITLSNPGNTALNIQSGSTLTLDGNNTGNRSLSLVFSGGNNTATVAGSLSVDANGRGGSYDASSSTTTVSGTFNNNGGNITSTASNLVFASGGTYNHNVTSDIAIPTASWNAASNCNITGWTTTTGPSNFQGSLGQSFGNFTWNSPNQHSNTDVSLGGGLTTVNGNLTITSTGLGSIALGNSGNGNLSVAGNFLQTSGIFEITENATRSVTVAGNFSISGGTFDMTVAGSSTLNVAGNFSQTGGILTESNNSSPSANIHFNGGTTQTYTSGGTVSGVVNFIVNSNTTLQMGTGAAPSTITGGGAFTLSDGATLGVTSAGGITTSGPTGNIQSTTRNYSVTLGSSSFIYNGAAAQVTGNGLPSSVKNLLMSNSAGLSLTNTAIVTGTLTLIAGNIDASAKLLSLSTGASIIGGTASSYILAGNGSGAGGFKRSSLTSGTTYNFPIGTSAYFLPASVKPATSNIDWSAYAFTPATKNGQYNGTPFSTSQLQSMVNAIWVVTPSVTSTTATLKLDWTSGTALEGSAFSVANSASYGISHFNGSTWDAATNTGGTTATSVTSTFSSFSPFGIGFAGNPLPVVLVDFNAALNNDKSVDLSWETQMELNSSHFNVLRSANGSNWSTIGTVEAKGNSSVITDYSFNDKNPLSGVNYYRLQMVDIDGHFGYSEVKVVKTTLIAGFSIFPNPAKDYINVSLNGSASALKIRLINQSGQILQEKSVNSSSATIVSIAVYSYPQGSYYLQVSSADGSQQTSKVLITR
jgi:hypothetical protein